MWEVNVIIYLQRFRVGTRFPDYRTLDNRKQFCVSKCQMTRTLSTPCNFRNWKLQDQLIWESLKVTGMFQFVYAFFSCLESRIIFEVVESKQCYAEDLTNRDFFDILERSEIVRNELVVTLDQKLRAGGKSSTGFVPGGLIELVDLMNNSVLVFQYLFFCKKQHLYKQKKPGGN